MFNNINHQGNAKETTMRYHLVRIAMIKKTRGREKGILVKC
jgi:hypothetical protein